MPAEVRDDITKEEAAQRQIDTAIHLLFLDADGISIHVLASSAAEILTDVCKAKDKVSFRDRLTEYVRDEYQRAFQSRLKRAYHCFKHADNDPDAALGHFDSDFNRLLLLGCVMDFGSVFGRFSAPMNTYLAWTVAIRPDLFHDGMPGKDELKCAAPWLADASATEQLSFALEMLLLACRQADIPPPIGRPAGL